MDKIGALPGITAVSASTGMPIIGVNFGMPFNLAGQAVDDPSSRPGAGFNMVTPEYFRTFGVRMIQGRTLTEQDTAGGLPVAVVNETFVKKYLSKVDPLTQRVVVEQLIPGVTKLGPPIEWQIVGVYQDRKSTRLNSSHSQISYAVFCLKKKRDPSATALVGQARRGHA